jgi:hypothetical protein
MSYKLNTTKSYHVSGLETLGWELTMCNALYPRGTPLRRLLSRDDSYGNLLYGHLGRFVPLGEIRKVLEVGGGYGYLMKDFLGKAGSWEVCMLDVSPVLLAKQRETLQGSDHVVFKEEDFLETAPAFLAGFDLAILNENLGDFPTLTNLGRDAIERGPAAVDENLGRALHFSETYNLPVPEREEFNLNLGALEALEKLCLAGVSCIYAGEHSCEACVPEGLRAYVHIEAPGNPQRISLKGHDEYSIKFSHLERVALALGYSAIRGPFADFINLDMTERVLAVLRSRGCHDDAGEMICHFVEDLYLYEYLILRRK